MSRKVKSGSVLGAVFVLVLLFHPYCWAWQGKVVAMLDADLLQISHGEQTDQIKLYGIECPKRGQPFWEHSRTLASHLAVQKTVEVTPVYMGNGGLENALVRIEGFKDYLNVQLISHGMAWVKPNECSAHMCAEWRGLENLARSNSIGLWVDPGAIPPWEWQKEQRRKILEQSQQQEKAVK
jgi:endonuclease YncB( thermonuclease family)